MGAHWIFNNRIAGTHYADNDLSMFNGVGPAATKLEGKVGTVTVSELHRFDRTPSSICHAHFLPPKTMERLIYGKTRPSELVIDLRRNSNPYKARRVINWHDKIEKIFSMLMYVCITRLVQCIHYESKEMMKVTVRSEDCVF